MVVTAGFADMHSHAQDIAGQRLLACDGVTTALELEAGVTPSRPLAAWPAQKAGRSNYGFAASWALATVEPVAAVRLDARCSRSCSTSLGLR